MGKLYKNVKRREQENQVLFITINEYLSSQVGAYYRLIPFEVIELPIILDVKFMPQESS